MKFSSLLGSKIILIFILVFLVLVSISLTKITLKRNEAIKQSYLLKSEIEKLEEKKVYLSDLIEYLKTPEYVEKEAKKSLSFQKPGEEVVAMIPSKEEATTTKVLEAASLKENKAINEEDSLYLAKWWEYFFGRR